MRSRLRSFEPSDTSAHFACPKSFTCIAAVHTAAERLRSVRVSRLIRADASPDARGIDVPTVEFENPTGSSRFAARKRLASMARTNVRVVRRLERRNQGLGVRTRRRPRRPASVRSKTAQQVKKTGNALLGDGDDDAPDYDEGW